MFYVVERYLPGLSRADLLPGLSRLEPVLEELRGEGRVVRYLGSAIVLEDEACFCQFEGPSETAVAEANRRADLRFDRIVPAVLVQPNHRSDEMSVSTSIPKTNRAGRSRLLAGFAAILAVAAVAGWAIATYVVNPGPRQLPPSQATPASALRPLTPQERQYVLGILSLSPAQLRAAFGTELTRSRTGGASNTSVRTVTTSPPGLPIPPACGPEACWHAGPGSSGSSGLASLTSKERGYAQAIAGMSRSKQAAAFGTGK